MARLLLSQEVHAPTGVVFDYVDRYENFEEFHCAFSKFEWTNARHKAGARLKMVAKGFCGLPTETETTAVVPEREIALIFVSGLRGLWEWLFLPLGNRTKVTIVVDYEVPGSVLDGIEDRASVERDFRFDMEKTLAALKERIELLPSTSD